MFIMRGPAPRAKNRSTAGAMISASVLPGAYAPTSAQKPSRMMSIASRTSASSSSLFTGRAISNFVSKGRSFIGPRGEFSIIADGHHEIHAIHAEALPFVLQSNIAEPLARDHGPYVILYPGL